MIEDNLADVVLTRETLKEDRIAVNLIDVNSGVEATKFLLKQDLYSEEVTPDLILLDLNLPGKSGQDVLKEIKSNDKLKHIPVVILTSSEAHQDIVKTYDLGASCYLTKPVGLEGFSKLIKTIDSFWFSLVKFVPQNKD